MKFIYLSCVVLAVFNIYSCKSQKVNAPQKESATNMETKYSYFVIGSGGGFTGKYNQFKVYETGKVEKLNEVSELYEAYSKIEIELTNGYFEELYSLHIESMDFAHPGNMTFFIQVMHDNELHTVKWGDMKFQINEKFDLFFEKVMTEIYKKER